MGRLVRPRFTSMEGAASSQVPPPVANWVETGDCFGLWPRNDLIDRVADVKGDPLDAPATMERLYALADAGLLTPGALARGLAFASGSPEPKRWQQFLSRVLLLLGAALVLAGIVYFFAFNWAKLGKFAKFGLIELGIVGSGVAAWKLGVSRMSGQVALAFAAILVGPLLAVYGQTYQTGADPYELFLAWALIVTPIVAISRFPALWMVLVVLFDTTLILWWEQVVDPRKEELAIGLITALLNGAAWLAWEFFHRRDVAWLTGRWMPRCLATLALAGLLIPSVSLVVDTRHAGVAETIALPVLLGALGLVGWYYLTRGHDLFMLAAGVGSAMVVLSTGIGRALFEDSHGDAGPFFFMGFVVIAEVAAAAWWLRQVGRDWGDT
jgi:uncharacterized membrane protein